MHLYIDAYFVQCLHRIWKADKNLTMLTPPKKNEQIVSQNTESNGIWQAF